MNKEEFILEINKLGINLDEDKLKKLERYYELLIEYNEKINLTAITLKEDVYLKHFYDSLTLIKAIDLKENLNICDIGTGAGFPGLVLKICFPNLKMTLVDSLEKRTNFLKKVCDELELENVDIVHSRIEDLKITNFDIVISRAVAKINILLELGCQLCKEKGLFIFMKGNIEDELMLSKNAISTLNYELKNVLSFKLPKENSNRNLVILQKKGKTNNKYPRQFTKIKKSPL